MKPFAALVAALICAPTTNDPHQPDIDSGYCPGGEQTLISFTYCDGAPYADGSYWHIVQYGAQVVDHPEESAMTTWQCVTGGGATPRAVPGVACGDGQPID